MLFKKNGRSSPSPNHIKKNWHQIWTQGQLPATEANQWNQVGDLPFPTTRKMTSYFVQNVTRMKVLCCYWTLVQKMRKIHSIDCCLRSKWNMNITAKKMTRQLTPLQPRNTIKHWTIMKIPEADGRLEMTENWQQTRLCRSCATVPDMNFLLHNMSFQKASHLTKRQDSYNICDLQ